MFAFLQIPDCSLLIVGKPGENGEIMGSCDDRNRIDLNVVDAFRDLEDGLCGTLCEYSLFLKDELLGRWERDFNQFEPTRASCIIVLRKTS